MKKTIVTIILCSFSIIISAQNKSSKKTEKPAKKTEKVPKVVVDAVEEEVAVMTVDDYSSNNSTSSISFEPIKNIRFNSKFEIYGSINDKYDFFYDKTTSRYASTVGVVDKSGNVILPYIFSRSYNNSSANDLVLSVNSNYGVFSTKDLRWTIPMIYDDISNLGNSLFAVKLYGKYGVVDINNNIIVPFEWSSITNIPGLDNYIYVSILGNDNRLKGIYSLVERKLTIPCKYNSVNKIEKQNYFSVNEGTKCNIVDINDKPKFSKWYDELTIPYKGKMNYIVKLDNKYGIIDDAEKEILPIEFTEFSKSPYTDGSYLARNKEGKYGFINIDGKVTLPFEYDNLSRRNYYDNVLSVQNGKCGLVQINSGIPYEIATCDYDEIEGNKIMIVKKDGKFGLLDLYGQHLTAIEYESIDALDNNSSDGIIYKAKNNGMYKLINEQGKAITEATYKDIELIPKKTVSSYNSAIQFSYLKCKEKNGKYTIIDKVGKTIPGLIFEDILTENNNIFIVKSNGKYGLYSLLDQKQIQDFKYELIILANDNYFGILGKDIDYLTVKSGTVIITPTIK